MRALVTGAAGFIGSRLTGHLLEEGHDVTAVDCFTPYYDEAAKRANLDLRASRGAFRLEEIDLRTGALRPLMDQDVVFHLAAQPGVRASWGEAFADYTGHNILATQRLLEAVRESGAKTRIVFASSSSVYGDAETYPTSEDTTPRPVSPYGVTKLAAENLLHAYGANFGIDAFILRFFTVYGPGQRPDMAFHRFIARTLTGDQIEVFGDGEQTRDVTYVDDVVRATAAAATVPLTESVAGDRTMNIAGGSQVSVNRVLEIVGELTGETPKVAYRDPVPGDVRRTGGDISRAEHALAHRPQVGVEEGLRNQVEWQRSRVHPKR